MTPRTLALVLLLAAAAPAFAQDDAPPASQQQTSLSTGQVDALMAPVALYPDALLSKILIASTFPDQVLDADNWQKNHQGLKGSSLDSAIARKSWDDNVKALTHIPGVLDMMSGQQNWMYQLGGAFVNQQGDVMASVQRLRRQAQAHGALKTTEQQRVVEQDDTIVIEPAQANVVYVPYYNPTVVYGAWAYPAYPAYYWPAPYGYGYPAGAFAAGLAWGAGVAISAAIWHNAFDWHGGNVYYRGGWYGHGAWNHGYYNNWHNNSWHNTNINIHNNNFNRNTNFNRNSNFNRTSNFNHRGNTNIGNRNFQSGGHSNFNAGNNARHGGQFSQNTRASQFGGGRGQMSGGGMRRRGGHRPR